MSPQDTSNTNPAGDAPVEPPIFPTFEWIQVRMPIVADEMTIWPGPKETQWDWIVGFPLELHPFAWDYLRISCDGYEVEIKPHYSESTWDTFWTNGSGKVRADALGGLFPFTLGDQVDLLKGIVSTLEALPPLVAGQNPDDATKIQQIHGILKTQDALASIGPDPTEGMSRLRRGAADFVWRRKARRLLRDPDSGKSENR